MLAERDALDGLMVVDLRQAAYRVLVKYMGEEALSFLAFHADGERSRRRA